MRHLIIAAMLLAGCDSSKRQPEAAEQAPSQAQAAPDWDLQSSGAGITLALLGQSGETAVRVFCTAGAGRLLVNVAGFRPIGSEERLSFGSGGEAVALVADSRGDPQRGGVSGAGPVPDNLAALMGGPISVSYGAQTSGPHPAPPAAARRAFVRACAETPPPKATTAGACRIQDGETIPPNLIRAVGTEPFWGARIDGRCVTYSHPDDQAGTRIWARFSGSGQRGEWTGFYANQRFILRTRPEPGCSDGMSDRSYPLAVELTVSGEQRRGCAEMM